MPELRPRAIWMVAVAAIGLIGCKGQDRRLEEHREKLESLGASTAAIGEAWLAGRASTTYARTALDQMLLLVEQERSAVASTPENLVDPRGAELSAAAEHLSRDLAQMIADVRTGDAGSVRRRLMVIPIAAVRP